MLEWYEYRYDVNKNKVISWNVFNNWVFTDAVIQDVKKYKHGRLKKDELVEALRKDAMWQFWSRVEYELSVGEPFTNETSEFTKTDVYDQMKDNMKAFTDYVIKNYKELYEMDSNKFKS